MGGKGTKVPITQEATSSCLVVLKILQDTPASIMAAMVLHATQAWAAKHLGEIRKLKTRFFILKKRIKVEGGVNRLIIDVLFAANFL